MSLDIYLDSPEKVTKICKCSECGHEHLIHVIERFDQFNITHNLTQMAEVCDLYQCVWRPDNNRITTAKQMIPLLKNGLDLLLEDPDKYIKYNPDNGWGSYDGLVKFIRKYLDACIEHPEAIITVSR